MRAQTPFYGCTNITCLLNVHPEVGRSLVAYAVLPRSVPTGMFTPGGPPFNTTAAIGLMPLTISVAPPDPATGAIVVRAARADVLLGVGKEQSGRSCRSRRPEALGFR